ncbi:hypothetical protein CEXT_322601 [Caerostris extrusa]|uniref:Uncharacterized protein n=1 Tax=Caerostris extrusa TaxID=172846 RepID=A0AAV4W1S2_CAEEX|nr:hypothetical protein CEXT_322601 [Caerostris extrusa]
MCTLNTSQKSGFWNWEVWNRVFRTLETGIGKSGIGFSRTLELGKSGIGFQDSGIGKSGIGFQDSGIGKSGIGFQRTLVANLEIWNRVSGLWNWEIWQIWKVSGLWNWEIWNRVSGYCITKFKMKCRKIGVTS